MKLRFTALLIGLTFLAGCEERKVFKEERIGMEVVAVHLNTKSNSKVDLRIIGTGYVYKNQRLSCSRSKAQNVKIGSKWDVTEMTYNYPESQRFSSELVGTSVICDRSN